MMTLTDWLTDQWMLCLARDGTIKLTRFLDVVIFQIRRCRTISCFQKKWNTMEKAPKSRGSFLACLSACSLFAVLYVLCCMLFLGEATSEGATCVQTKTDYPQNTLKYTDIQLSVNVSVTFIFCQSTHVSYDGRTILSLEFPNAEVGRQHHGPSMEGE